MAKVCLSTCGVTFWEMRARSATRLTIFCAWRGPDEPLFVECEVGLQERLHPPRQRPYLKKGIVPFRRSPTTYRSTPTQGAEAVKKISPIAWQHINLHGRYEFQKPLDPLDVDAIIREMTGLNLD